MPAPEGKPAIGAMIAACAANPDIEGVNSVIAIDPAFTWRERIAATAAPPPLALHTGMRA